MTTINLHQASIEGEKNKHSRAIDGGFFLSIAILVLVLGGWGVSEFYLKSLAKKNTQVQAAIAEQKTAGFVGDKASAVADFQKRIDVLVSTQDEAAINDILSNVSKTLVQGVSVDKFGFNKPRIILELRADGYLGVARQLLSFKKANNLFSEVSLGNIKKEDNRVMFEAILMVK